MDLKTLEHMGERAGKNHLHEIIAEQGKKINEYEANPAFKLVKAERDAIGKWPVKIGEYFCGAKTIAADFENETITIKWTGPEMRPNDIIKHIPTGETWTVCGVNYERDELVPCGYPFPSLAKLSDCVLEESRGIAQTDEMKNALKKHGLISFVERGLEAGE